MESPGSSVIHSAVVLGKQLRDQRITREYAGRVDFLIRVLSVNPSRFDMIAFCGGSQGPNRSTEAKAGLDYFKNASSHLAERYSERIFLDETSSTTIENVRHLVEHISTSANFAGKARLVTILSSDYHIQRLEIVDACIPEQSLLRQIRELADELTLLKAPYYYDSVEDPFRRWLAILYRLTDTLTIMCVNIEGVLTSNLSVIAPQVVEIFGTTVEKLREQASSKHRRKGYRNVEQVLDQGLATLLRCHDSVHEFAGRSDLSEKDHGELTVTLKKLSETIQDLKDATDPDEPLPLTAFKRIVS